MEYADVVYYDAKNSELIEQRLKTFDDEDKPPVRVSSTIKLNELDPSITLLEFHNYDFFKEHYGHLPELIARCPELQSQVEEACNFSLGSENIAIILFPSGISWIMLIEGKIYDCNFGLINKE